MLNTSVLILDKKGNEIKRDCLCFPLSFFIGIDTLKTGYKATIINFLPEGLYVIDKVPTVSTSRDTFVLRILLYNDIHSWLEENHYEIEKIVNLFDFPITLQVGKEIINVSISNVITDFEEIDQEKLYDVYDFIANKILETIDELL